MPTRSASIANSLIDRFADGGRVEILDALAGPLPATVVADIIGIPEDRRDVFLDWKEEVIGNPEVEFTTATSERYQRIRALFQAFIAARRAQPADDMISTLVVARTRDGAELDDQAVLGLLLLFLGGGQETTGKAITSGVRVLATQPQLQSELRARPGRIPAFIEELLRVESPVKGIFRIATRDTQIGEVAVPEGSFVQLMWGSGNRDEAAFDEPDVFDPNRFGDGRRPEHHILTFGHGIHLCPGAPLARLQTTDRVRGAPGSLPLDHARAGERLPLLPQPDPARAGRSVGRPGARRLNGATPVLRKIRCHG